MNASRRSAPRRARAAVLLACVGLALGGCRSSGAAQDETRPYVPLPDPSPDSIGYFLSEFDASLRAWNNLRLAGRGAEDERTRRGLEKEMGQRARKRQDELLRELEAGPPANRAVAAVALGFTHDPAALSPLCAALSDTEDDVVLNALLGLGVLASPDTPLGEVTYLLRNDPDPWIRSNAAFALQSVVAAGAAGTDALERACRDALADAEAGVRAQCASTLGLLGDAASVDDLGDLLYDDAPLVAAASASALARIGSATPAAKGSAARLLADALGRTKARRRSHLYDALKRLAEANLGDEPEAWQDWARRLP